MKRFESPLSIEDILKHIGLKIEYSEEKYFDNVAQLTEANPASVCFFENKQYLEQLKATNAGLIIVPKDFDLVMPQAIIIKSSQPYMDFMILLKAWLALENQFSAFIAESAVIDKTVKIGKNVYIGENVVISKNSTIGDDSKIEANCVIKENVEIGSHTHLYPNVTIYRDCKIGNNNILHSGVVIGADGFGYIFHNNQHHKVPQVGNVVLEDNVEIGSNSCVDRGTLSSTIIRSGTKLDNLVQVGHNCKIGRNTILCAQAGLAGSTEIGNVVFIAGQAGLAGHLKVEDYVQIGAQSGVTNSIKKGEKVFGTPAIDAKLRKKIMVSEKRLPEIVKAFKREQRERK
jgi:UDP-3-O-[3-hydroxymyristoyl] glucosamine N-acyltransferase